MPVYQNRIKRLYHRVHATMAEAEHQLWRKLRGKQVLGVQFYRQKPVGDYLVDFYAYKVGLGIEVHSGQIEVPMRRIPDAERDVLFSREGLKVLRFEHLQVLGEIDAVIGEIHSAVRDRLQRVHCSAEQ